MKWLRIFGYVGLLCLLLSILVFGTLSPGYSHISQSISELGAKGAPNAQWINLTGIVFFGLSVLFFSVYLLSRFHINSFITFAFILLAFSGLCFFVAGIFNCDPGCDLEQMSMDAAVHNYASFLGYILGLLTQLILGLHFLNRYFRKPYYLKALVICAFSIATFSIFSLSGMDSPYRGLYQRLFILCYCYFLFVTANYANPSNGNKDTL